MSDLRIDNLSKYLESRSKAIRAIRLKYESGGFGSKAEVFNAALEALKITADPVGEAETGITEVDAR